MHILGLLGIYFDAVVVEVEKNLLIFRLDLAILFRSASNCRNSNLILNLFNRPNAW